MGLNLKKLLRNDTIKVGLAAGGGFLLGKYAPQIQSKITDVRKIVQAKRNALYPNYGKGADDQPQAVPASGGMLSAAITAGSGSSGGGMSFLDRLLDLLFGKGA